MVAHLSATPEHFLLALVVSTIALMLNVSLVVHFGNRPIRWGNIILLWSIGCSMPNFTTAVADGCLIILVCVATFGLVWGFLLLIPVTVFSVIVVAFLLFTLIPLMIRQHFRCSRDTCWVLICAHREL